MRAWPALLFACSCGLDESGLVPPSSNDASVTPDVVSSPDAAPSKEAGPPQACSVDAGACVASLPAGWDLVAFDPSNENACPSNYTSAAVIWNVSTPPGVCDCGCTVTKAPVCDVGTLQRYVSTDNSCNMTGISFSVNGAGCTPYSANPLASHSKSSPLPPTGGTCTGDPIKIPTTVARNAATACAVPATCEEQFCNGDVPGGFQSCIQKSGAQQACPAGWSNPVVVGDDFSFDCSACSCDVNGPSTCTNASVDIFSDSQCNSKLVTMPVDGNCDVDSAAGQSPGAFEYHATLTQTCNATGTKTASNLQLANARTICCK